MENSNSEKLIERIEEAKDWLDKAKDEYSKANPVRGGLILSLAQAEVKHAWELSHHQFVSKSVQKLNRNRKHKYFIPIAASLVLFTGLVMGARVGGLLLPTYKKPAPISIAKSETGKSKNWKAIGLVKTKPSLLSVTSIKPEPTALASQPSNQSSQKSQTVDEQTVASVKAVSSLSVHNEPELTQNKPVTQNRPTLKPVSQLSIDEEALTKEASHSLRNGK